VYLLKRQASLLVKDKVECRWVVLLASSKPPLPLGNAAELKDVMFVHTDTKRDPLYPLAVPEKQDASEKNINATMHEKKAGKMVDKAATVNSHVKFERSSGAGQQAPKRNRGEVPE
jgi:hypothetical protein